MAPPKRKTGGRTTPKGTKPGQTPAAGAPSSASGSSSGGVAASSRYTPPIPHSVRESARWVPILMIILLILGTLTILARYLLETNSNWPVFIGLGFIMGGLYTATKWH
ncbi:MAG: cell division protein CrgA [Actinobacteria bacterium]|nr:cell division protein CrgA [Actinomycetota bacterium]